MDNKQKIVNIIMNELTIIGKTVSMDFDKITRKIDALYKRDCTECIKADERACVYCSRKYSDLFEEADK